MKNRILFSAAMLLFVSFDAQAGVFETGTGYSYRQSSYNGGAYTRMKSWNASFGYFFTRDSEVEFVYQDSTTDEFVPNVQDIRYRDRVYSLNLVYHFFSEGDPVRPYVRTGVGQLNRDATGTYTGGFSPAGRLDQVTVIGGLGIKAKIIGQFSIRAEATSYLTGGSIATWQDNIALSVGGAFYF